jgi:3'-phosphoadenosine 5'-phosphosulfate sulfotransferase (PAPS reductase)/FAD synthetase
LLRTEFRHLDRPLRVLHTLGLRAAESPARARRPSLRTIVANSHRDVAEWLPNQHLNLAEVWQRVDASGVDRHWAYTAGVSRLSCSFCPLASRRDLLTACRLRPELASRYAALEAHIGHRFQQRASMAELITQAGA